jgi:hypothetical protein
VFTYGVPSPGSEDSHVDRGQGEENESNPDESELSVNIPASGLENILQEI